MAYVNHINLTNAQGQVYCRKRDKIVVLDDNHMDSYCANCDMFQGSAQGEGVECYWNDPRKEVKSPHTVVDPQLEKTQLTIADNITPKEKLVVKK